MKRMLLYTRDSGIPMTMGVDEGDAFPLAFKLTSQEGAVFRFQLVDRLGDGTPIYKEVNEAEGEGWHDE